MRLLSLIIPVFLYLSLPGAGTPGRPPVSSPTPLAAYGALVFERENCGNCHYLDAPPDDTKVALGKRGRNRSTAWYYNLFIDPLEAYPDGRMPGFQHLAKKTRKEEWMLTRIPALQSRNRDSLRNELQLESAAILQRLKKQGIQDRIPAEAEVLALIAFLEQMQKTATSD